MPERHAGDPGATGAVPGTDASALAGAGIWRTAVAGPGALYLYADRRPSPELARFLGAWRRALAADASSGIADHIYDTVPAYASLMIEHRPGLDPERVEAWALDRMPREILAQQANVHELRVAYGDQADRSDLASRLRLPFDEIAARHASATYTVAFLGFTAGFPYLLGLPDELSTPRRERPRERTPAGAVAIAGDQAGIYPSDSPGGWWVLGRTDAVLFDPGRDRPALLEPGDRIRFRAVERLTNVESVGSEARRGPPDAEKASPVPSSARARRASDRTQPSGHAHIEVAEAWPRSASLQGAPRRRVGHLGMAECGALDPLAFGEANGILGNPRGAAALEAIGNPLALIARTGVRAVVTGGGLGAHLDGEPLKRWRAFDWHAGAVLELVPERGATGYTSYVGVLGGFTARTFAASPSTDARAGVGGAGRFLAAGDILQTAALEAARVGRPYAGTPRYPDRVVVRIHPGPQRDESALAKLARTAFRVAVLDRTGVRLAGDPIRLGGHETASEGSPAGAVQIPPDGRPIVLLADRGRTGGYAKPAIVDPRDLWRLAQAGPGTEVWFHESGA